jgi:hypothetical protein
MQKVFSKDGTSIAFVAFADSSDAFSGWSNRRVGERLPFRRSGDFTQ